MSAVRRTPIATALLLTCAAGAAAAPGPAAAQGEPNFGVSNLPIVHVREGSRVDEQIDLGSCPDGFVCHLRIRDDGRGSARPGADFTLTTRVATSAPYERPPLSGVASVVARDDGVRENPETVVVEATVEYMRADPRTPYLCADRGCPVESSWRWVGIVVISDKVKLSGRSGTTLHNPSVGSGRALPAHPSTPVR